jgi:hypothetical protein
MTAKRFLSLIATLAVAVLLACFAPAGTATAAPAVHKAAPSAVACPPAGSNSVGYLICYFQQHRKPITRYYCQLFFHGNATLQRICLSLVR